MVVRDRKKYQLFCGPSRTKQSFRDEVDINKIIAKHAKTGMIDHLNSKEPFYGDVSGLIDYQHSLEVVNKANEMFMDLSADIREKFANDPMGMITFLADPKNLDEAIKLGMVVKRPETPPVVPEGNQVP